MYNAIFSFNTDPLRSGEAAFNAQLSAKIGAQYHHVSSAFEYMRNKIDGRYLFSFKMQNIPDLEIEVLCELHKNILALSIHYDIFFHSFSYLKEEQLLLPNAKNIYVGNNLIQSKLKEKNIYSTLIGIPPLLVKSPNISRKTFTSKQCLKLFSFGMYHKFHRNAHLFLAKKLRKFNINYKIVFSLRKHEKDITNSHTLIPNYIKEIYGEKASVLVNLPDDNLLNEIHLCDSLVLLYEDGLLANNTTATLGLSRKKAVITNLGIHSPSWHKHNVNCLDFNLMTKTDLDPVNLNKIERQGFQSIERNNTWALVMNQLNHEV